MTFTACIVYGRDPQLIETRSLLLRNAGYQVWPAVNLSDIAELASSAQIHLLLLCHSLSKDECERALILARSHWPDVKSLLLLSALSGCQSIEANGFLYAMDGPAKLLETVGKLISGGSNKPSGTTKTTPEICAIR